MDYLLCALLVLSLVLDFAKTKTKNKLVAEADEIVDKAKDAVVPKN